MQKMQLQAETAWKYEETMGIVELPHVARGSSTMVQYGNSTGTIFFEKLLEFGIKSFLRMWQTINIYSKNLENAWKMHYSTSLWGQGQFHYGIPRGAVLSSRFAKLPNFASVIWET